MVKVISNAEFMKKFGDFLGEDFMNPYTGAYAITCRVREIQIALRNGADINTILEDQCTICFDECFEGDISFMPREAEETIRSIVEALQDEGESSDNPECSKQELDSRTREIVTDCLEAGLEAYEDDEDAVTRINTVLRSLNA